MTTDAEKKRELLLFFAENEKKGNGRYYKFDMNSNLLEMEYHCHRIKIQNCLEEILSFEEKGYQVDKDINLNNSSLDILTKELHRLRNVREIEERKKLLGAAFLGLGLLSNFFLEKKHKITCLECSVENNVSLTNAPVVGIIKDCLNCQKEHAQVYQPQCGHVCLCKTCLKTKIKISS